jgi:drug/metabolite transporter (DMT)-like permease
LSDTRPDAPRAVRSEALRGIVFISVAVTGFAITDAMIKALGPAYHPMQIIFIRTVVSMALIGVMVRRDGGLRSLTIRSPTLHVVRGINSLVTMVVFVYAFQLLPLAEVQAIGFAAPLIITIMAVPILGEPIGWRRMTAVAIGFLGVLFILRPGAGMLDTLVLLPLVGTVTFAFGMVLGRKLSMTDSNAAILLTLNGMGLVVSGLMLPFVWVNPPTTRDVLILLAFGVVSAFGQYFQLQAYRLAPAGVVGPFQYMSLLWGLALGWIFWGEWPDANARVGAAIVVGSGLYILWRETVRARSLRPVAASVAERSAP